MYSPSQLSKADFVSAMCPSVDRLRGIREVIYAETLTLALTLTLTYP